MNHQFPKPESSRRRIRLAFAAAILADGVQLLLGPVGWFPADEIIDVVMMVILSLLIGFHPLFLPTFFAELIPMVDMLPTWTGCVIAVVALRKRQTPVRPPPPTPPSDVIDV